MFARIKNSWELVKASAAVLSADKELIIFPIVSSIGVLLVTLSFALPFFVSGLLDSFLAGESRILGYGVLFLFYLDFPLFVCQHVAQAPFYAQRHFFALTHVAL